VIGLTGSIGMGKSTAARAFIRRGAVLFDADATVHRLLGPGGRAVRTVLTLFPEAAAETPKGRLVNRRVLGGIVFADKAALRRLEAILHPMVRTEERAFLARCRRQRARLVVLDIPLLFEARETRNVDAAVVVSAPTPIQRSRVLGRQGMTAAKLDGILRQQLSDREKRRRADFVVPTGLGRRDSLRAVEGIIRRLRPRRNVETR